MLTTESHVLFFGHFAVIGGLNNIQRTLRLRSLTTTSVLYYSHQKTTSQASIDI